MGRPTDFPMLRLDHPVLTDYRQRLTMADYKPYTIRDYSKFLRRVLAFSRKDSVRTLTQVDINLFLQYLQQEGVTSRSIYKYVCASRNLIDTYRLSIDRRDLPRIRRHIELKFNYLTPEEVGQIIEQAVNLRDKALISLAYECAMRVGEVSESIVGDYDPIKSIIHVRTEKWGPRADIPIMNPLVNQLLQTYIREWELKEGSPLFPKRPGRRKGMRPQYISTRIFHKLTVELGWEGYRFHDLRHSRATLLRKKGVDTLTIQKFMRHKSIVSTQGYIHLEPEDLRREIGEALRV